MFNLKYEIKTDEETGRPYVLFPDQVDHPEHKFMALEVCRYLLIGLINDNEKTKELTEATVIEVARTGHLLEQISDEVANIIVGQNNAFDELGLDVKDDEDGED